MNKHLSPIHSYLQSHCQQFLYLSLIIIAAAVRFWHLTSLFHWTLDEEYWSYIPFNIATGYHLPLIGGPASGTGFYLGPFFVWLMAPIFWLVNSNPTGIAFFVSALGVVSVTLIYKLWSQIISPRIAFLTALFYAISTLATIYDRKYWNATPISLLAIISVYLVHRLQTKPSTHVSLALALALSIAFNAHLCSAAFILFTLLSLLLFRPPRRQLQIFLLATIILQTPLYLFELRHRFTNLHALTSLLFNHSQALSLNPLSAVTDIYFLTINTFGRLLYFPALDIARELTLCTQYAPLRTLPPLPFQLLALFVLIYAATKLRHRNLFAMLIYSNLLLLFIYRLIAPAGSWYPGILSEYYLLPSFAAFLAFSAQLASACYRRAPTATTTVVLMIVIINLYTTVNLHHSQSLDIKKQQVNQAISLVDHQPFTLSVIGDPCQIYGYRYLFSQAGVEPVTSYLDPLFLWLYYRRLPHTAPEYQLTINADSGTIDLAPYDQQAHQSPQDSNPQR